ncbi:MAG: ribonuclease E/G, partial [Beijerinckiaceae bacterium]
MPNKMLIDSTHPEETRVVVTRGNRVEEFDFESASRKPLRGNIYLAKVTRVEPSLQAAFVEYGGNRHGFLAFSEIHPDYYQIPVADRLALIEDEERQEREAQRRLEGRNRRRRDPQRRAPRDGDEGDASREGAAMGEIAPAFDIDAEGPPNEAMPGDLAQGEPQRDEPAPAAPIDNELTAAAETSAAEAEASQVEPREAAGPESEETPKGRDADGDDEDEDEGDEEDDEEDDDDVEDEEDDEEGEGEEEDVVEQVGGDAMEEMPERPRHVRRHYKIQEVIKRRQILLVQVAKEERGTKGAALTTYLSLAGRYSVLMPNTARGGGVSRKITSAQDRKRLKEVVADLEVPQGMGVILRTAGENRTKAEIKRDYEYLMRLWENVRNLTL